MGGLEPHFRLVLGVGALYIFLKDFITFGVLGHRVQLEGGMKNSGAITSFIKPLSIQPIRFYFQQPFHLSSYQKRNPFIIYLRPNHQIKFPTKDSD